MKNYLKKLTFYGLPLTIITFCLITAKADQYCDGDHFTAYGFPMFWTTPGATSLSTIADLMAGAFDLAFYFIVFAVVSATSLFDKFAAGKSALVAVPLWIIALFTAGWLCIFISFELRAEKIVFFPCEQKNYRPHFGLPLDR